MTMTRREWVKRCGAAGVGLLAGAATPGMGSGWSFGGEETGLGEGSLKAHAARKRLPIGAAVNAGLLNTDETYRRVLAGQFSMVVAEDCMKWEALRPSADTYSFGQADELVSFAEGHGMKVRGHNLCWHESIPGWVRATVTRESAERVLTEHIRTVVGRYKGRIHSWDVVNEAIWIKDGRADGMRSSSLWYELLGPAYVEIAFRAARAADPGALLTYNDYGFEYDEAEGEATRTAVLALLKRLRDGRVPVDAVGIQSHLKTGDVTRLGDGVREFAKRGGKLGLQVFVTELDVNDDGLPDEPLEQQDRDVAAVYRHYLDALLKEEAVTAVLLWGVADGQSWLQGERWRQRHPERMQRPLPFLVDEAGAYRAKPAYFALRGSLDRAKSR